MEEDERQSFATYRGLLIICCGAAFLCYFGSYMRLPVVPLYARSLGADTVQVGAINAAFFMTAALLSFPLGLVSDRLGRKLVASAGLIILAGTSFLLYFSSTPAQLVLIYLLFGIGLAAFGPTMMSFVADISPPTHLGRSYGWYTTALYGGMSLGPAVGGAVAQAMGYPRVFLISGAFIFANFWLILFVLPRSPQTCGEKSKNLSAAAKVLFRNRPLMACWLATLGGCFGLGMFITFVPLHAQNQDLSVGQIGFVFSIQGIVNALSRIPFGHMSDRVTKRGNLVVAGIIGLTASMAGFAISTGPLLFMFSAGVLGAGMGLAFTSIGALTAEVVPPELRGLAMGGYNTSIYLGLMLNSAFMGAVIKAIGFYGGFFISASVNLLMALLFYFLMRSGRAA
jgi:MFS family permease